MKYRRAVGAVLLAFGISLAPAAQGQRGGGYTLAGLVGAYYPNPDFSGQPGFTRRDVRLDFGPGQLPPGGAGQTGDPAYRSVPAENFSVRWTGQVIPRFSENYLFRAAATGKLRLRVRAEGSPEWSTVIDQPGPSDSTGSFAMASGTRYDVEISFVQGTGPWSVRLLWSSPSADEEVIDPVVQSGINNPDWTAGFADIVKGARNSWEPVNNGPRPAMDADGWPLGDGAYVFQESLNQGLDIDPLMRGRVSFSFKGKATVSLQGNAGSLSYQYHAASNLTTGTFTVRSNGWNASYFRFASSDRDGQPGGPAGITELRLMRPTAPDAPASYPESALFAPQLIDALGHFTVVRHQYVANQQRDWEERTRPGYFNQHGGAVSSPHYGVGEPSNNGASWEHKVLLANESGRDLMLSLPTVASGRLPSETDSYIWKLANLLRYGSDGVNPYTAPVPSPVYPPLNPNLRVYLEIENELWNWAGVFYTDYGNINALTTLDADAANADFQAINFDQLSTAKDGNGVYTSLNTWRYRKIMVRLRQISDIFRSVFGDDAMMSRVRPLYEWQYDNANDTARLALTFADRYFNNGNGQSNVASPRPVSDWLWGGGGAAYYGAVNGNGLTELLPDPVFAVPALAAAGYLERPAGGSWNFSATAGIARDAGAGDDIPAPWSGSQMGYLTDRGQAAVAATFPAVCTSSVYAVSFKAVNRTKSGSASPDRQNIRVFLDGTNDITARTFSQGNGYTPPAYDAAHPWYANNVFWTRSEYFYTRSFEVLPGSTHTITFRGMGDPANPAASNQTAFLGEVRVTSVDRIFLDGMPGGGEATGQPLGQNIRRVMNSEASWAKAFGLEQVSYESGWSLGGDDGGSWLQLRAKYGDTRTAAVQGRFMDYFHLAGSAVNVFGTYAQWPSWADYYAEQGLLNVAQYPIVRGIDDCADRLPPEPDNGTLTPALMGPAHATLGDQADLSLGRITSAGGWISWNLVANRSGDFRIAITLARTNGTGLVLLDDQPLAHVGGATNAVVPSTRMTQGLHSLKIRSVGSDSLQIQRIAVSGAGAPESPGVVSAIDGDGLATLTWTAVPGAVSYEVRYGTSPGFYTVALPAGTATNLTARGLAHDRQYFFVVIASNANGDSLPSAERGVIPLRAGEPGRLAVWEFTGYAGSETTAPAASASSRVAASSLVRGTGLTPSRSDWAASMRANRFASEPAGSVGNAYGADLPAAIARNQYYQLTVSPAPGRSLNLDRLAFRAFFQNGAGGAGLSWSTNGSSFSPGIAASGSPSSSANPWTVDLTGLPGLRNCKHPVTFRIYLFGLGAYQVSALGGTSGDDIAVVGSLVPSSSSLTIEPLLPNSIRLSWPVDDAAWRVESIEETGSAAWSPVPGAPQLVDGRWTLETPVQDLARFYRLAAP